jgi:ComF family protein
MDAGSGAAVVHALKYGGWSGAAVAMGRRMARVDFPRDVREERTALVPVPLSPTRERERGYNQAERLATVLGPLWDLPVWRTTVRRTRHTQSQVRLTPSERTVNVSHAFTARAGTRESLRGAHIVLVDDVITTAATLNATASALVADGARIISYLTFGRAPDPGDRAVSDIDFDQD